MQLRQKFIFLAIAPLIVALCAIALFVRQQAIALAQRAARHHPAGLPGQQAGRAEALRRPGLARDRAPDRVRPQRPGHAGRSQARAGRRSASATTAISSSTTWQGRNLMHPRQPELVGRDLWNLREPVRRADHPEPASPWRRRAGDWCATTGPSPRPTGPRPSSATWCRSRTGAG